MVICGYDASTGSTRSRNALNSDGSRSICETGTDNPWITRATKSGSCSRRAVSALMLSQRWARTS